MSGVFPSLRALSRLLPALDGVDRRDLVDLPAASCGLTWDQRIQDLIARIERETDGRVPPRNVIGYWDLAAHYRLLVEDDEHVLHLSRRGGDAARHPEGRVLTHIAGREGLRHLVDAVARGATTLAELLPEWSRLLEHNPRFTSPASHPRSLGQRVAALVADGWLAAHGDHAERLADEAGFRRRESPRAFARLGGGLALTDRSAACAASRLSSGRIVEPSRA